MNKIASLTTGTAACLLLAAAAVSASGSSDWRYAGQTLEGAFQVVTTLRVNAEDCTTAALLPPFAPNPFESFNMFHEGGTMTEHGSRSPPSLRSPGFGIWERVGGRRYENRFMFHSFDVTGALVAVMDVTSELTLSKDGSTFEGVARLVRTPIDGTALNFCGTMTGERFTL